MGIVHRIWLAAVALAVAQGIGPASAQTNTCINLQAQLAALDRSANGASNQAYRDYDVSVNQQRIELDRATAEARRAGCLGGGLFIFQRRPDAKCGQLMATIDQMRANLARLTATRNRYGGDPSSLARQRNQLLRSLAFNRCGGRYATYDGGGGNRGLLSALFGQARFRSWGEDNYFVGNPYGTYRTLCVRTCDGYYFPISFSTVPERFAADEQTCQSMCPAAEVKLYTYHNPGEDPNAMVSIDGEPYTALPTAFRYRSEYDPNCTCGSAKASAFAELSAQAAALTLPGMPETAAPAVPTPSSRPVRGEDPETLANRVGNLAPHPAADSLGPEVAGASAGGKGRIRIVGPEYYVAQ